MDGGVTVTGSTIERTPSGADAPGAAARRRARPRVGLATRTNRNRAIFRSVVLLLAAIGLLLPLVSLFDFSVRFPLTGNVDFGAWTGVVTGNTGNAQNTRLLGQGVLNSLVMSLLTVAIMLTLLLPTMVWVRLRVPRMSRVVEFICLLPLTIPAVVLVVGLAPIYRFIATNVLDSNTIWLSFAYVILVLPFSYRAFDAGLRAIDLQTLTEAARLFGANWATIILRVIMPNMRSAIISACFISIAVVLGEFTIARLLARTNLQTALFQINLSDGQVAAVMSLLALVITTVLLVVLDLVTSRRPGTRKKASA